MNRVHAFCSPYDCTADEVNVIERAVLDGNSEMPHVIIRSEDGRWQEVDFGEAEITVSLHAGAETIELAFEAEDPDRPSHKRRFALMNIPRHLFSKAIADLARQDRRSRHTPRQ